jgi:exodeoxyribonuclease VII large subunit
MHCLTLRQEQLSALRQKMQEAVRRFLAKHEQTLMLQTGKLEAVSPVAVLHRGYALVYRDQSLARDASALSRGDLLQIRLASGTVTAQVTDISGGTTA